MWDYFSQTFSSHLFWWVFYSVSVIFIGKRFNNWNSFWVLLSFPIIWCNCCCILKTFFIFIFWIYYCFTFFYPVWRINESIYEPSRLKVILWHFECNSWTESTLKLLPFIDISKPIQYFKRSDFFNKIKISCVIISR